MAEQDKEQHLDQLLDSLLATYSDAKPRPGLEIRLLANLRAAEQQKSTSWRWRWLLAGATAALIFAIVMAIHLRQPGPLRPPDNREMVKTPEQAPIVSHDV